MSGCSPAAGQSLSAFKTLAAQPANEPLYFQRRKGNQAIFYTFLNPFEDFVLRVRP